VVDNVSSVAQASSIYFGTLGQIVVGTTNVVDSITSAKTATILLCLTLAGCNITATVTTSQNPTGLAAGQPVTIAGVVCGGSTCSVAFNSTYNLVTASGNTITYVVGTCGFLSSCSSVAADANKGTVTGPPGNVTAFGAVKLTQSGLQ
jgi:hypothetical protein